MTRDELAAKIDWSKWGLREWDSVTRSIWSGERPIIEQQGMGIRYYMCPCRFTAIEIILPTFPTPEEAMQWVIGGGAPEINESSQTEG